MTARDCIRMRTPLRSRWMKIALFIALPIVLYLVMAEWLSWQPRMLDYKGSVEEILFSPDGKTLAASTRLSNVPEVRLWDVKTRTTRWILKHSEAVSALAFSPDCSRLASVDWLGKVRLWDLRNGKLQRTLPGHYAGRSCAFSPDGGTLAIGKHGGSVKVWNTWTGELKRTIEAGSGDVYNRDTYSIAFSPDGKVVVISADYPGPLRLWNVETGTMAGVAIGNEVTTSITFSPDGKLLASESGIDNVSIWDVQNGQLIRTLIGHGTRRGPVIFSPDGSLLVYASC